MGSFSRSHTSAKSPNLVTFCFAPGAEASQFGVLPNFGSKAVTVAWTGTEV